MAERNLCRPRWWIFFLDQQQNAEKTFYLKEILYIQDDNVWAGLAVDAAGLLFVVYSWVCRGLASGRVRLFTGEMSAQGPCVRLFWRQCEWQRRARLWVKQKDFNLLEVWSVVKFLKFEKYLCWKLLKYIHELSVEGSKYQRCDFENGLCDLIRNSDSGLSGWVRTSKAQRLEHDHTGNSSGKTLIFKENFLTNIDYLYLRQLVYYPFFFRTFLITCTLRRKPNHCRPNQSHLPAQPDLPGPKNSPVGLCWEMRTQSYHSSSSFFSLYSWVSTITLAQNMDVFRFLSRIRYRVTWQRCGKTQHSHSWKHGRGRWLRFPATTAFRCVTFNI